MSFNCWTIFRVRSQVTYRSITKNYCIKLTADNLILSSINFTEKKNENQWSWKGIWYSVMRVIFPLTAITSSLPGLFVWNPGGLSTSGQCTLERISVSGKRVSPLQGIGVCLCRERWENKLLERHRSQAWGSWKRGFTHVPTPVAWKVFVCP